MIFRHYCLWNSHFATVRSKVKAGPTTYNTRNIIACYIPNSVSAQYIVGFLPDYILLVDPMENPTKSQAHFLF